MGGCCQKQSLSKNHLVSGHAAAPTDTRTDALKMRGVDEDKKIAPKDKAKAAIEAKIRANIREKNKIIVRT